MLRRLRSRKEGLPTAALADKNLKFKKDMLRRQSKMLDQNILKNIQASDVQSTSLIERQRTVQQILANKSPYAVAKNSADESAAHTLRRKMTMSQIEKKRQARTKTFTRLNNSVAEFLVKQSLMGGPK
jgi:uncharacterized protein with ATP-grasp and redox domains